MIEDLVAGGVHADVSFKVAVCFVGAATVFIVSGDGEDAHEEAG